MNGPMPPKTRDGTQAALARQLRHEMAGAVADDPFTCGRYATDASIYQIMPRAVAWPRTRKTCARRCRLRQNTACR
jgi:hypothetical protein